MPATDTPLVTARRKRLQAWIEEKHAGSQVSFIKAGKINQGLLSGLLGGGKSFGEKQAERLEIRHKMPKGYLVNALADEAGAAAADQARLIGQDFARVENDIDVLTMVMGSLVTMMARHRPTEAEELAEQLKLLPAKFQDRGLVPALQKALAGQRRKAKGRASSSPS